MDGCHFMIYGNVIHFRTLPHHGGLITVITSSGTKMLNDYDVHLKLISYCVLAVF